MTDGIILTSHFEKNLSIISKELEESGKILEKDLWVRAHSRNHRWERLLKRYCTS